MKTKKIKVYTQNKKINKNRKSINLQITHITLLLYKILKASIIPKTCKISRKP